MGPKDAAGAEDIQATPCAPAADRALDRLRGAGEGVGRSGWTVYLLRIRVAAGAPLQRGSTIWDAITNSQASEPVRKQAR